MIGIVATFSFPSRINHINGRSRSRRASRDEVISEIAMNIRPISTAEKIKLRTLDMLDQTIYICLGSTKTSS